MLYEYFIDLKLLILWVFLQLISKNHTSRIKNLNFCAEKGGGPYLEINSKYVIYSVFS